MSVEAPQTRLKRRSITRPSLSPENYSFSWINAMGPLGQFLRRVGRIFRCHWRTDQESLFGGTLRGTEPQSATLLELRSSLVAFRGENRFRIGARNFAHRDPAESADKRAN